MGYVRTAGMSTAARRARRRAALVIVAVLLALLLVFGIALAYVQGWVGLPGGGDGATDEATTTTSAPATTVTVAEVSVNVYNAGGIAGAAGRAGDALRARGFGVGTVANDPEGADVPGVAVVRHGPTGVEEATLLVDSLPDGVELVADTRSSSGVDLVLGQQWQDLPAADGAAGTEGG